MCRPSNNRAFKWGSTASENLVQLPHCCHSGLIFLSRSEFRPFTQKWSDFGLNSAHLV